MKDDCGPWVGLQCSLTTPQKLQAEARLCKPSRARTAVYRLSKLMAEA